ncbi:MAG: hypothetical protein C4K48_00045 [Candidatus Thorarchaeota archaeon]|nr:MAG: hypothetical protein C4K48_00045 [Candidatus Thorarchaeota archaeon]
MNFSHVAYPGSLAELAAQVVDRRLTGKLLEYYLKDLLIGVGVVAKQDDKTARFVVDVTKAGIGHSSAVISKTAKTATAWKVKSVVTSIPKDQMGVYSPLAKWSSEISTDIPVTRLL